MMRPKRVWTAFLATLVLVVGVALVGSRLAGRSERAGPDSVGTAATSQTTTEIQAAVERFAPVLAFDREQRGYPMDPQVFFDGMLTEARDDKAGTITWVPREATAGDPLASTVHSSLADAFDRVYRIRQNTDSSSLNHGSVPTYYHVDAHPVTGALRIVYYWFYGYQYPCFNILGGSVGASGAHLGDWEQVMVTTSPDRTTTARLTVWQHGGWYTKWDFQKSADGRPVVYVGKDSHGSYHFANRGSGARHDCTYFGDPRQPSGALPASAPVRGVASSYWWTSTGPMLSLASDAQPWMAADRVGTLYPGTTLAIQPWVWGPTIAYWTFFEGWHHETAVGSHPTRDSIDWSMGTCKRKTDTVFDISRNGCEQDSSRTGPFPAPGWVDNPAGGWPDWIDAPGLVLTATSRTQGPPRPGRQLLVDLTIGNPGVDCVGLRGHPVTEDAQLCVMPPVEFNKGTPYSPYQGSYAVAHDATLTARLPRSVAWSLADPVPDGCAINGDRLLCTLGDLPPQRYLGAVVPTPQVTIHLRGQSQTWSCPVVTAEVHASNAWRSTVAASTQAIADCQPQLAPRWYADRAGYTPGTPVSGRIGAA